MARNTEIVHFGDCEPCGERVQLASNGHLYCPTCNRRPWSQADYDCYVRYYKDGEKLAADFKAKAIIVTNITTIERPTNKADRTGKCGGRCLNGKHSCDCAVCEGKCHGASRCTCGDHSHQVEPAIVTSALSPAQKAAATRRARLAAGVAR